MSASRTRPASTSTSPSQVDEAYRSLRSTVKFAAGDTPVRSVLVVDIDRDETSVVAARLADAFAEAGDRCVLIDTDARATGGQDAGFFDLLAGANAETSTRSGSGAAWVGPGRSGSPDALASEAFSAALEHLTEAHETAVLSCAPLPKFADALAIAPRVDAVVLVVTAGSTRRPRAVEAREALDRVGARILGVVMIEPKKRWFW